MHGLDGASERDISRLEHWRRAFPNMRADGFEKTSDPDVNYNCIAWAVGITNVWLADDEDANYFWPVERMGGRVEGLIALFTYHGYTVCKHSLQEHGFEKVALYAGQDGKWTHAARQLHDGRWTTKDGCYADIAHATPECVCPHYGRVHCYMKRSSSSSSPVI